MQVATVTGNVSLTTAAAIVGEIGGASPGSLVRAFFPNITGIATTDSVTVAILRTDTGAQIGSATITNSGAGTSAVGPVVVEAAVPAGNAGGFEVTAATSASTGTAVASATAPIVISVLP